MTPQRDASSPQAQRGAAPAASGQAPRPWWLGLAVMVLGAVCLYAASALPATAQYAAVGPGLLVMAVGLALLVLGMLLLVQIARGEPFETQETENAASEQPMDRRAFATALVAVVLPALLMDQLGLPLTAMLSFALVARAFGSRSLLWDLFTGLLLGSAAWWGFGRLGLQLGGFLPLAGM